MAICPFSTSVNGRIAAGGTGPIATVRVMSVVPSAVLRAAVDEQELARRHLAVRGVADPVVHDRAVRAGAGDGVEGDVAELAGGGAERFELLHHVDLAQPALRRGGVEPGEELGHRRAVAQVRGAGAGDLGRVLAGLGQDAGVALGDHFRRAGGGEPVGDPGRRAGRIDADPAAERLEPGGEGLRRQQADLGAEMGGERRRRPARGRRRARPGRRRGGSRRRAAPACAAMSEPRMLRSQAIESGSVSTEAARSRARRPRASSARLSATLRPASASGCGTIGRGGRRRLVRPDPVDQVLHPHQPDLPRQERRAQRLDLLARCAARGRSRAGRRRAAPRRASRPACPRAGASPRRRRDRPGRCTCSR